MTPESIFRLSPQTLGRPNLTYIPVVSRPQDEPVPWRGSTGHVQGVWTNGVLERAWGCRPEPEDTHVFMCGSPQMGEAMIALLAERGFNEDTMRHPGQIHVEKYWG